MMETTGGKVNPLPVLIITQFHVSSVVTQSCNLKYVYKGRETPINLHDQLQTRYVGFIE